MKNRTNTSAAVIIAASFVLQLALCAATKGHPTDVGCFLAWSDQLVELSPANFYTAGMFADYPPGGMYLLGLCGLINRLLGIVYTDAAMFVIAVPSILCNCALAYIAFLQAKKRLSDEWALVVCGVVAFNPALILDAAVWKQLDSVFALLIALVFMLLHSEKKLYAAVLYGYAVIFKPQALMFGPVFAIAYLLPLFNSSTRKKGLIELLYCAAASVAVIFIMSWPFKGGQSWSFVLDKLFGTATSYDYATVNAANLYALLGANWTHMDSTIGVFSYRALGGVGVAAATAGMALLAARQQKNGGIDYMKTGAFYLFELFAFGPYMHERYLLPAIPLLLIAFARDGNRRSFYCAIGMTAAAWCNMQLVLYAFNNQNFLYSEPFNLLLKLCAALTLAVFAGFAWTGFAPERTGAKRAAATEVKNGQTVLANENRQPFEPVNRLDYILCGGLTLLYAVMILTRLGTTEVPVNGARLAGAANVDLGAEYEIGEIWYYSGVAEELTTITDENGDALTELQTCYDNMYRWKVVQSGGFTARRLRLLSGGAGIMEIVFVDTAGNPITPEYSDFPAFFDEQSLLPQRPDFMTGMYFDELYHGRTAQEYIQKAEPYYENTHPPLGKLFIALGISAFGMTPLGWRVVPALFAVLSVAVMYMFARLALKTRGYGFFAAFLFALDFMAFVQGRFATLDVIAMFFILLSYFFMLIYWRQSFYIQPLKKTLLPLALCGIAFGLSVSVKWTGLYSGAGLAVLFFWTMGKRYSEHRRRVKGTADFSALLVKTLLWCALWFVCVPLVIYCLSFVAIDYDFSEIISIQKHMYWYHSQLTQTHYFSSPWWSWLFDLKPLWLYMGERLGEGVQQSIASMGNPAVWWSMLAGFICMTINTISGRKSDTAAFLTVAALAQLLPWVFVTRATFIYHYLACVPFMITALGLALKDFETGDARFKYVRYGIMAASAACWIAFYPVIAGVPVSTEYAKRLLWFSSWEFYHK